MASAPKQVNRLDSLKKRYDEAVAREARKREVGELREKLKKLTAKPAKNKSK